MSLTTPALLAGPHHALPQVGAEAAVTPVKLN